MSAEASRSVGQLALALLLLVTCLGNFTAHAQCKQPYSWVAWSTFQGNNASGVVQVDGKSIQVSVRANYAIHAADKLFAMETFSQFSDYKSLPTTSVPRVDWSTNRNSETIMCFSEPVTNPVLVLATLGNIHKSVTLAFSRPYTSLFTGKGNELIDSQTIKGTEGNAVLLFPGTFSCLTIKTDDYENFTDFTWGIRPSLFPLKVSPPTGCSAISVTATGGATYEWTGGRTPGSGTNTFDKNGTYLVKATDVNGCTAYGATTITMPAQTEVRLGTYPPLCTDQTVTLTPSVTAATGSVSYSWASGETTPSIRARKPGRYEVTVQDGSCTKTAFAELTPAPPPVLKPDTIICLSGPTATLDAGATGSDLTYNWLTINSQLSTVEVSRPGRYQVRVTNPLGCTATRTIDLLPPPMLSLGPPTGICSGREKELIPILSEPGTYTFSWSTGETKPTIRVTQPGLYQLTATNGICTASAAVMLTANPAPVVPPNETVCYGMILSAGNQEDGVTYLWANRGETTPDIGRQPEGVYAVTVTDILGCSAVRTITVRGVCPGQVLAPNAFTPNGDGVNDVFSPMLVNGDIAQLTVYNRWGVPVYDEVSSHPQWDGKLTAVDQTTGAYTYKLSYRTLGRDELLYYQGTLLLLK